MPPPPEPTDQDNPPPSAPAPKARHPARNTRTAYARDWALFARWCRLQGLPALPPSPDRVAQYLIALAAPPDGTRALSRASVLRRLSGLVWSYAQRGTPLDRRDARITSALAACPPDHPPDRPAPRTEALSPAELHAMIGTLPRDLRGLRDRAILLLGHAAGLRRSEIVALDLGRTDAADAPGWVELRAEGITLYLRGKTGLRQIAVARGGVAATCPVHALTQWLHFARIDRGPIFTAITRDGRRSTGRRLADKHIARLVKQTAILADLPDAAGRISARSLCPRRTDLP